MLLGVPVGDAAESCGPCRWTREDLQRSLSLYKQCHRVLRSGPFSFDRTFSANRDASPPTMSRLLGRSNPPSPAASSPAAAAPASPRTSEAVDAIDDDGESRRPRSRPRSRLRATLSAAPAPPELKEPAGEEGKLKMIAGLLKKFLGVKVRTRAPREEGRSSAG